MAVNQVCFVHVLTQTALIWLPTFQVSVVILQTRKKNKMWFKSHAFKNTQWKTPWRRKAFREMKKERKKESKVQQLLSGREQVQRKTVPTEQMDYLQWLVWSKTHLNNCHTSKHLVQNEPICPKQNHLGFKSHLEHNVWTIFNLIHSRLSLLSRIPLNHLNKANNSVITVVLWTNMNWNLLWQKTNMREVSQWLIERLIFSKIRFSKICL